MAQDTRKALDEKTRKLTRCKIENGKEHAAYQESQQQLLAIQAEQQQNLAVARAESKASFENNQTLAQAAELGAISAAEAEQAAAMGAQAGTQLNPATQQILSKYVAGQPKFQRSQSHSQQVTKQNITINNNITSNTTNDVKVPANIGGPIQGRPLQFKTPSGEGSVGKFKSWISAAFARQNEEGAKRDREYRHRESSLTKSASKMMKKLEDIGKTIGSRMDPRKIGSTWQSQLKTLLLLFGFGYLTSNWTKVLETVSDIEQWVRNTWNYFSEGGFSSNLAELFGGKPRQGLLDSLKTLFLGDAEEKGLLGHLKQFFKDMWEERAEAVKLVKAPEIGDITADPMKAIKSLFEYLSNILVAAFSGAEGIKKIRLEEAGEEVTKRSNENRIKNSTTDNITKRKIDGENQDVEWGTSSFLDINGHKAYQGISHHMLEGNELTSKFGAESSVSQMSDITRLLNIADTKGEYDAKSLAISLGRLSRFAKKQGMIPIKKSDLLNILDSETIKNLEASGDIVKNVPYREVIREKTDDDYYRNALGNNYTDPRLTAGAYAAMHTYGAEFARGGWIHSIGTVLKSDASLKEKFLGVLGGQGTAAWIAGQANKADEMLKNGKAKYRIEYVRADSPKRHGDIETGKIVLFDEVSKKGIQAISKNIISRDNKNFDENTVVDPEDETAFASLIESNAEAQFNQRKEIRKKQIQDQIARLRGQTPTIGSNFPQVPYLPDDKKSFGNWDLTQDLSKDPLFIGLEENTKKEILRLQREYNRLDGKFFGQKIDLKAHAPNNTTSLEDDLADVAELEARVMERDQRRQEDWDNSAAGRMTTAVGNATYNISDGRWGTHTEKIKARKSVDDDELKRRKQYLFKLFREKGLSDGAASGIIGNLEGEGLNRGTGWDDRVEDPPKSGKYSMGIAQFNTGGELPNLKTWAKKNGLNYQTFETQAQYIANHPLIDKIKRETQGLSPQESLKKSAIIWGHDFERFVGNNAADNHGNLIGKGSFQTIKNPEKYKNDPYRKDGKLHGDENYAERIQKGLNTYNTYSGADLSEIILESSRRFEYKDEEEEKKDREEGEGKSFLSILKDYIQKFVFSFGGIVSKVNKITSPVVEGAKKAILKDGKMYGGPITEQFTNYQAYLDNQDNLPDELPKNLDYVTWKNTVYDLTGSMPQNLTLRKDSSDILKKYEKTPTKEDKEEEKIPEKVETSEVKKAEAKVEPKPDLLSIISSEDWWSTEKDYLKSIRVDVSSLVNLITKLIKVGSLDAMTGSYILDAVNNQTNSNLVASANATKAAMAKESNKVDRSPTLYSKNNVINDIAQG